MSAARINDSNNYHLIAEQLRSIANIETDPQRAEIIRRIADDYVCLGLSAADALDEPGPTLPKVREEVNDGSTPDGAGE